MHNQLSRIWIRKEWPIRENMIVGEINVIHELLVGRDKIILPPLHIKLKLMRVHKST